MEEFSKILHGIASLSWPLIIFFIIFKFRSQIVSILESLKSRKFTIKVGGNELTIEEVSEQQRAMISDLQNQLINIQKGGKDDLLNKRREIGTSEGVELEVVNTILWVDDIPKNNAYLIAKLQDLGINVITSTSTSDALSKYSRMSIDRIITDMGRNEDGKFNPTAGLDLIKAIREHDEKIPIIVSSTRDAVKKYEKIALEAGANGMTNSPSEILKMLNINIR